MHIAWAKMMSSHKMILKWDLNAEVLIFRNAYGWMQTYSVKRKGVNMNGVTICNAQVLITLIHHSSFLRSSLPSSVRSPLPSLCGWVRASVSRWAGGPLEAVKPIRGMFWGAFEEVRATHKDCRAFICRFSWLRNVMYCTPRYAKKCKAYFQIGSFYSVS